MGYSDQASTSSISMSKDLKSKCQESQTSQGNNEKVMHSNDTNIVINKATTKPPPKGIAISILNKSMLLYSSTGLMSTQDQKERQYNSENCSPNNNGCPQLLNLLQKSNMSAGEVSANEVQSQPQDGANLAHAFGQGSDVNSSPPNETCTYARSSLSPSAIPSKSLPNTTLEVNSSGPLNSYSGEVHDKNSRQNGGDKNNTERHIRLPSLPRIFFKTK